ncbi:hypothetical protein ES708_03194 [subsurface metagenome]
MAEAGGVDDHAAAFPDAFEDIDQAGIELGVLAARPAVVLDHFYAGLFLDIVADGEVQLADGDHGGVPRRLGVAKVVPLGFAGEVDAGDI